MRAAALVCGVDEAGRGPLAGPVYAAAVVLDPERTIRGLADSKTLPEARRLVLNERICERALEWRVAVASVEEIDALNILQASMLAMRRAVEALTCEPAQVLVDGNCCPPLRFASRAIIGGDASVAAISAASIVAKVARDAHMRELHRQYPDYGFDRHKGYATPEHLEALVRVGVSPIHRRSFAPVRARLEGAAVLSKYAAPGWPGAE